MRFRSWHWHECTDEMDPVRCGKFWVFADIGEWSLCVAGCPDKFGLIPVTKRYHGPWHWSLSFGEGVSKDVNGGPCKTLGAAKRAAVRATETRMREMMKALKASRK